MVAGASADYTSSTHFSISNAAIKRIVVFDTSENALDVCSLSYFPARLFKVVSFTELGMEFTPTLSILAFPYDQNLWTVKSIKYMGLLTRQLRNSHRNNRTYVFISAGYG